MSVTAATRRLVDEFRARPTLRAGTLITTVFGDSIAPRGGTVWIGSLIRLLGEFGASERLVRTSMFRLTKDGWFEAEQLGRRSYYRLTETGAARFEQATHRIYGEHRQHWDGRWTFAVLAALEAAGREQARRELGWLGFGALSANLMAHPAPDAEDLDALLARIDPASDVLIVDGSTRQPAHDRGLRALAEKSWNLDDIDARYGRFSRRFRPVYTSLRKARRIDPQEAFIVRTLAIQAYRKILLRDPLLPAELLPAGWQGTGAYQLCRNLYRAVYAAADRYLGEATETADGPLPPPEPAYYRRFGGLSQ